MELRITIHESEVENAKAIIEEFIEFEKEHSPHCTLLVEVEIN